VFVGAGRSVVAGTLALLVLLVRRERFSRAHWRGLVLAAAGAVFGFPLATALALRSVPAMHATIVIGIIPIATALYAMARTAERPSPEFWLASSVGAGAVLLFGQSQGGLELGGADGFLLVGVACAAVGYSEGAKLARTLGGFRVISWTLVLSLPGCLVLVLAAWPERSPALASAGALGGFAYVSIVSMYLGMVAWYHGLSRGSLAQASQIQLIQPLLSLGWAWALLGEPLAAGTVGTALVVLGCVAWSRRARVARLPVVVGGLEVGQR